MEEKKLQQFKGTLEEQELDDCGENPIYYFSEKLKVIVITTMLFRNIKQIIINIEYVFVIEFHFRFHHGKYLLTSQKTLVFTFNRQKRCSRN